MEVLFIRNMFYHSKQKHINFKDLHEAADNLAGRIPMVRKRRRLRQVYKILKYFFWTIVSLLLITLILLSVHIFNFKQIYDQAIMGKSNLEQAIVFARQKDFNRAASLARAAENNFDLSINKIELIKRNYIINHFPLAVNQLNNVSSFIISVQFLSKAVYNGSNFGQSLSEIASGDRRISFSQYSQRQKRAVLKKIFEAAPELTGIKADLDLAYFNLEQTDTSGILFFLKNKINQSKEQISQARLILDKAVPLSQLIPALAGYPVPAKYLVMLQNDDELRPTGGFLGTYGILETSDGEINRFDTHDIYHLDMPIQSKLNIIPPEPIKKYLVKKWYMRDANWSPDWPTASEKIQWFYQTESALNGAAEKISKFDGVIGITPKLITDFLRVTGPVVIEGQSYDENNFQNLLQYRVEKGYWVLGVPSWERKEVIGEIAKVLKVIIFDLPPEQWSEVINIAINNLSSKNIMFYLTDKQLENVAIENGWGGEIKNFSGDYFMVVDANMAALKTDAVMNRGFAYEVNQGANGLFSKLTISYAHNGKLDWKTSAYKSYTRVYTPAGSQLIKISGYEPSEIDIGREAGKTYFGFYLTVAPGTIKNLTIEYKLPQSVVAGGSYSLYLQKQPGKEIKQTLVDLNFQNNIKSYSPANLNFQKTGAHEMKWEGDLNIDRIFEVNL